SWGLNPAQIDMPEISHVPDKLSLENQLHEVTLQTFKNDKQGENEEDYDDDEDDEWDWNESGGGDFTKRYTAMRAGNNPQANRQSSNKNSLKMSTPSDKVLRKFENKINLDKLSYADSVINKVTVMQKQREADTFRVKDKSDRATVEQVLDPRTRMILFKMLSRGVFSEINGCISTGKEKNIKHCCVLVCRYHNGEAYIIDVSQSVEHDHPHALEFLRKDCSNVNGNYTKHNVAVMTVRELFEFITDPSITSDNINQYLDKAMEIASERTAEERSNQDKVDEEVFKKAYIPRTLTEVTHYERDVDAMLKKKEEASSEDTNTDNVTSSNSTKDDSSSSEGEEEDEDDDEKSEGEDTGEGGSHTEEAQLDRKERKKMVKEAQREKRKNNVPKYVKKRKEKVAKMKKGR
uniref:non-specific serine/threonine protein kinase n=1 Tax=Sinocyclocheilus rhinocerous TaxID=307959 RepID=A0A673FG49_9TELE